MKKIVLGVAIILLNLPLMHCGGKKRSEGSSSGYGSRARNEDSDIVYVCKGKSKRYHSNRNCGGLGSCTHEVIETTEEDAESRFHRTPCKLCY